MEIKGVDIRYNSSAISKKQFDAHIKLYRAYVAKLAGIEEKLVLEGSNLDSNAIYSKYRGLKKGETFALDSIILHEEYFHNMTDKKKTPGEKTIKLLTSTFGSLEAFFRDFKVCCLSARGWCITAFEQRGKTVRNILCDAHDYGIIVNSYPLIVMDMYEHAYFIDYETDKERYINAFIENIDWDAVEKRAERVTGRLEPK